MREFDFYKLLGVQRTVPIPVFEREQMKIWGNDNRNGEQYLHVLTGLGNTTPAV